MSLQWFGPQVLAQIWYGAKKNMMESAQDLQANSSMQAPKDTGDLRGNCSVDDSETGNEQLRVRVGYNLAYALRQHEELDYHHADGKAKYLEDPFNEKKDLYMHHIGEGLIK